MFLCHEHSCRCIYAWAEITVNYKPGWEFFYIIVKLGIRVSVPSIVLNITKLVFKILHQFIFPPSLYKNFLYIISSQCLIFSDFTFCRSYVYEVTSNSCIYLTKNN